MNEDVKKQIETMVNSDDVVLFMKGNPDFPQCGFSANVVGLLNHFKIKFKSYDVLQDEVVRQGIKEYSNWPTIPQIYVKNEFIGGCDILNELASSGELQSILSEKNINHQIE
tara:strand:- start:12329 stop:12664 length:336 start_codon:yes stop_codon:yes gene_type:complete